MGAYPAERGKRGPPAAPCPGRYPARSRLRTSTRFRRQGCSRFSSYPRPNSPAGAKRSGGTCGSQPVEPTANDVIGASCPHGRLFRSGHQSPLLNTKEPLCPAPLVENPRTGSFCSKRPKSIEFYRILQRRVFRNPNSWPVEPPVGDTRAKQRQIGAPDLVSLVRLIRTFLQTQQGYGPYRTPGIVSASTWRSTLKPNRTQTRIGCPILRALCEGWDTQIFPSSCEIDRRPEGSE